MSNDRASSNKRRRKFSIDDVRISEADSAATRRVIGRLTGRVPFPEAQESELLGVGSLIAQGSDTAQGSVIAGSEIPAQSIASAPGSLTTEGIQSAQGSITAQSDTATHSSSPAQSSSSVTGGARLRRSRPSRVRSVETVAPQRDFTKTANSIVKLALSGGLFRGKSKQLYDYLYSKTRGAIVPSVSAQISRADIMRGSHIGSTHTLRDNLRHLRDVGLVSWTEQPGQQEGNVYFVYLPEELQLPIDMHGNPVQMNCPDHPDHVGQNLPRPPSAETALRAQGTTPDTSEVSGGSKTSFKTIETDDDENPLKLLREAERELTGSASSIEEWRPVIELLVTELKVAGARTSVTSAPAFLAEHLRRRLSKAPTVATTAPTAPAPAPSAPAPLAPPTHEELIDTYVNFLHTGQSVDEVDALLSPSVDPERWPQIKQAAIERYQAESHSVCPPQTAGE